MWSAGPSGWTRPIDAHLRERPVERLGQRSRDRWLDPRLGCAALVPPATGRPR
jgi:hypothetical protein